MIVDINKIKELRKITNISILDCKKALNINNNDLELSLKYLKNNNIINKYNYKLDKYKEKIIFSEISDDKKYGFILEINSNDFYALNNKESNNFYKKISNFCIKNKVDDFNIIKNNFNKDLEYLIYKLKSDIKINNFYYMFGESINNYNYMFKISVLVNLIFNKKIDIKIIKELLMNITFIKPLYIYEKDINKNIINNEINKEKNIMKLSNCNISSELINKIISAKIDKFINSITLEKQKSIIDNKTIIKDILNKNKIIISNFKICY